MVNRGEGILKWISSRNVESFVILDDESFDYKKCDIYTKLVKSAFSDDNGGLQDKHVEMAIEILSNNIEEEKNTR